MQDIRPGFQTHHPGEEQADPAHPGKMGGGAEAWAVKKVPQGTPAEVSPSAKGELRSLIMPLSAMVSGGGGGAGALIQKPGAKMAA